MTSTGSCAARSWWLVHGCHGSGSVDGSHMKLTATTFFAAAGSVVGAPAAAGSVVGAPAAADSVASPSVDDGGTRANR